MLRLLIRLLLIRPFHNKVVRGSAATDTFVDESRDMFAEFTLN